MNVIILFIEEIIILLLQVLLGKNKIIPNVFFC